MEGDTDNMFDLEAVVNSPIYENAHYAVGVLSPMSEVITGIYVVISKDHLVVEFADSSYPKVLNWADAANKELQNIGLRRDARENKTKINLQ